MNLTAHTKLDLKIFQGRAENFNITWRAFLMTSCPTYWCAKQWNGGDIGVSQTNPVGVELFIYAQTFFVQWISKAAGHVSENVLNKQEITPHLYFANLSL